MLTYEERIAIIKAAEARVAARKTFCPNMDRLLLIDEPELPRRWQERININRHCNRPMLHGIQID